ncbi:hypothetical protein EVAR_74644_1 [Eumeta japonica]|uniref:Uncharacterized protein n=1 Tax=Eumeta variegata TaxID=151549 RepID=A0A4C1WCD5_EUMVA|nr:hypothetical protein EVAR_74644_1 [Eumeta japonica]
MLISRGVEPTSREPVRTSVSGARYDSGNVVGRRGRRRDETFTASAAAAAARQHLRKSSYNAALIDRVAKPKHRCSQKSKSRTNTNLTAIRPPRESTIGGGGGNTAHA